MSALRRKLLRDLIGMKGQAIAIALVVAAGVSSFVCLESTYRSLDSSKRRYYEEYRLADVFASLKRAPEAVAERLREIPGVARVDTRVVAQVVLDVPGMSEPASGRILSIPAHRGPVTNDVFMRVGRLPEPGRTGEVLASESFAKAHGLGPGDRVSAIINGRRQSLRITGLGLSPEYIFQIRPGEVAPDDRLFGIFWMQRETVAAALDMEGAFNDVSMALHPGAKLAEVLARTDRILERFGGIGGYGQDRQLSNHFVSNEIAGLRGSARFVPAIFLGVAAFLLNIALTRVVAMQRSQIASLKALGYSSGTVGLHYLELVLVIVLVGAVLGLLSGSWLGRNLTQLYTVFYHFPVLDFVMPASTFFTAFVIAMAAGIVGGVGEMRRVAALPAAEAMRPEPPPVYRPTVVERIGLQHWLSQPGRMILRNLERRPARAMLSVFTMSLAVSVLVLGLSQEDMVQLILDLQFVVGQRQEATVTFIEPRSRRALHEMASLPGVLQLEPFRIVPVTLHQGHRTYDTVLIGLGHGADLRRVVSSRLEPIEVPPRGIALTDFMAEQLGILPGDPVTLEVRDGRRRRLEVTVTKLVDELIGICAYTEIRELNRLLGEGAVISGAYASIDTLEAETLYTRMKNTPAVASVGLRRVALRSFEKTLAENLRIMRVVNVMFAVIIAFGVVYNAARITLSERSRELGSLRVLGFSKGEISFLLLGELAVLTTAALPLGCLEGYGFVALLAREFATDLFRVPVIVSPASYAQAVLVVAIAATLSALVVRRKLDHLDLVAVLKTAE